ncbi:MAG: Saccharopine dehydrogenase [Chloroflexi bacterium ADurb.Bin222]|nr:MAG: Saccharopine dehydrogenase [Chloroflexi bacterium ADurb.Bin222]
MARTVGLPAAIAARLLLEGTLQRSGVLIPILPEVFEPVLTELERHGIRFEEDCQ